MNRNRWILMGAVVLVLISFGYYTWPTATVVKPPVVHKHAPAAKKAVVKPAIAAPPAAPQQAGPAAIINIYSCCPIPPLAPVAAPPAPQSAPAPAPDDCSEAYQWQCSATPSAPVQPQVRPQTPQSAVNLPTRTVNVLSGNTFQLNILSGNGSGNGGTRYGHGSIYGWTPGHEVMVCEPAPRGCYRKWITHPQPSY